MKIGFITGGKGASSRIVVSAHSRGQSLKESLTTWLDSCPFHSLPNPWVPSGCFRLQAFHLQQLLSLRGHLWIKCWTVLCRSPAALCTRHALVCPLSPHLHTFIPPSPATSSVLSSKAQPRSELPPSPSSCLGGVGRHPADQSA